MLIQSKITDLKGIGDKTAKYFAKLNIGTVEDLLYYFPRGYESFNPPCKIGELLPEETQAVYARVTGRINEKKIKKGSRTLTITTTAVSDASGTLQLTFFNMPYIKNMLKTGGFYVFRGKPVFKGISATMEQPALFALDEYEKLQNSLLPVYPLTKGLTNHTFRKSLAQALGSCVLEEEYYPGTLVDSLGLLSQKEALQKIHFPENFEEAAAARKRFVFDEFFKFLYILRRNKEFCESLKNEFPMIETADTIRFLESLPFPLTKAQKKVWQEIREDLNSPRCMNRLVQGDVGSGKTIIAFLALLETAANGYQGALMAPTEVLAVQHYEAALEYTRKNNLIFKPVLLVGSMTAKEKREAYEKIKSGEANLIIGTHALIQDKVEFRSLGLVVTDEQHRFGVHQREQLSAKGSNPHILVMSATPIPRTLAIILYGDLQVSVIDELPANRLPIKNCVVNTSYRSTAYKFIAKQVAEGRQVYVICPQVEEGELEDLENVVDYTDKLKDELPSNISVAYLHGKMRPADKNRIMQEFAAHDIDVLVSTTVIEVGINVPNATVMMVENAERFGLAQLHQLRGRVGRGEHQSYCIFISSNEKKETLERLNILNHSNDGFFIASEDLKLRGPGDLFGIRQSGDFAFRIGDVFTDASILKDASLAVEQLLSEDHDLLSPEHVLLKLHLQKVTSNDVDFRSI